jgi:hypothetical protein
MKKSLALVLFSLISQVTFAADRPLPPMLDASAIKIVSATLVERAGNAELGEPSYREIKVKVMMPTMCMAPNALIKTSKFNAGAGSLELGLLLGYRTDLMRCMAISQPELREITLDTLYDAEIRSVSVNGVEAQLAN